ncbi:MAG: LpxI family protein [Mariniblastus sp.]
MDQKTQPKKIGLVAGWGQFPVRVAKNLIEQGHEVHCVAIKGHADPLLADLCHSYRVFGMGRMGAQVRFLRRAGVGQATMAGKIFKTLLFKKRRDLLWHLPDLTCVRHFYPVFISRTTDQRDDTLLNMVVDLYSGKGINFAPPTDFAPELLVKEGTLTRTSPSSSQMRDIKFGWAMAKQMGGLDIGQTVVVKDQAVMAVEAIEGTDECIRRAGGLCHGGFTVVKVAKPNQDMRFDVPTVGVGTIETISKAGGKILAIEAEQTIVLDEEATIKMAEKLGISIVALKGEQDFSSLGLEARTA